MLEFLSLSFSVIIQSQIISKDLLLYYYHVYFSCLFNLFRIRIRASPCIGGQCLVFCIKLISSHCYFNHIRYFKGRGTFLSPLSRPHNFNIVSSSVTYPITIRLPSYRNLELQLVTSISSSCRCSHFQSSAVWSSTTLSHVLLSVPLAVVTSVRHLNVVVWFSWGYVLPCRSSNMIIMFASSVIFLHFFSP